MSDLFSRILRRQKMAAAVESYPSHEEVGLTDVVANGWYLDSTDELVEGFKIENGDIVVDVGCGGGLATHFSARKGADVVFVDIDPAKVAAVQDLIEGLGSGRKEGIISNSLPLPLPDASATKVLAMEVLEHTEQPAEILKELVRVGRPGAQYLITVPHAESERVQKTLAPQIYFEPPNHIQIFDKEDLCSLVEGAGLQIESYRVTGFFWTMWWSLFWIKEQAPVNSPVLDSVSEKKSDVLDCWTRVWHELLQQPGARPLMDVLNNTLPKSQAVIARKL